MKAENRIDLNIDNKGKGRRFESRFLQAGLVKYSFGVCLLSKEVIDRFAYKFVGCPVIIDHKDITDENAKDERVGVISKVWFNEFDGWFWCEGVVFDDEAISLIKDKGYNVSCQYNIDDYTENTANSLHNGNPYNITILDGTPEHLAIVKNPRYEEALIAVNKGEDMKAENTEFRTGYDSEGDAYVYPIDGADDKKSDKKGDKAEKKEDKVYDELLKDKSLIEHLRESVKAKKAEDSNAKIGDTQVDIDGYISNFTQKLSPKEYESFDWDKADEAIFKKLNELEKEAGFKSDKKEDKKDSGYKIPDDYKNSVKDYTKEKHEKAVDFYGDKMATAQKKSVAHPDNETYRTQFEEYKALKDYHEQQATKSEDKKQPKQLKLFNALEEQLERFVSLVAKNFDESKHKRDEDGKFTDSGNFSGKTVDEQEAELVKELKRLKKNGKAGVDGEKIEDMYKRLTGKEWQSQGAKKEDKKQVKKSQKIDGVKFDKVGKLIPSILKDMEKAYKESK